VRGHKADVLLIAVKKANFTSATLILNKQQIRDVKIEKFNQFLYESEKF
jgi:5,10-methylene-tetrahydrofolate dehydrogenase/methenyl tetrahydrofolate cyclohydrolase